MSKDAPITHVAFLRGINVGGNRLIKMADLKKAFESLGLGSVQTLIASGNVAFAAKDTNSDVLTHKIQDKLKKAFGHDIPVILRTADQLRKMAAANPFKSVNVNPATRFYVTFLAESTKARLKIPYESPKKDFRILKTTNVEIFSLVDASKGSGTLESMAFIEKEFGKNVTTRNWNTINRMLEAIAPAPAK